MLALALAENNDVNNLREENMPDVIKIFEEYAATGLDHMEEVLDKVNLKESVEQLIPMGRSADVLDELAKFW